MLLPSLSFREGRNIEINYRGGGGRSMPRSQHHLSPHLCKLHHPPIPACFPHIGSRNSRCWSKIWSAQSDAQCWREIFFFSSFSHFNLPSIGLIQWLICVQERVAENNGNRGSKHVNSHTTPDFFYSHVHMARPFFIPTRQGHWNGNIWNPNPSWIPIVAENLQKQDLQKSIISKTTRDPWEHQEKNGKF